MKQVVEHLTSLFYEREEAIKALALAFLAREHIVLLGPPGTAKTFLVDAMVKAVGGLSCFKTQFHPTMPAEAVVGPINLGFFERGEPNLYNTTGFAPEAEVVCFDEVFKGSWALHTLTLTLMQKRVFHNGRVEQPCPLITLIGTSNEMPREEGLEATWDRFLLRVQVAYLQDKVSLRNLVLSPPTLDNVETLLSRSELLEQQRAAAAVELPEAVVDRAIALKDELRQSLGIEVGDRRLVKALYGEPPNAGIVRAAAFLDGRQVASVEDLEALAWVLWQDPGQIAEVTGVVYGVSNPIRQAVHEAKDMAQQAYSDAIAKCAEFDRLAEEARRSGGDTAQYTIKAAEALMAGLGSLREAALQLEDLGNGLSGRSAEVVEAARRQIKAWQQELMQKMHV